MSVIDLTITQIATLPVPNSQWGSGTYAYPYGDGILLIWFVGNLGAIAIVKNNGEWCIFRSTWGGVPTFPDAIRCDGANIYYAYSTGFGVIPIPTTFVNGAFFEILPFDFFNPYLPANITTQPTGIYIFDGPWVTQNGVGYEWHVVDSCVNVVYYFAEYAWISHDLTVTISNGNNPFNWQSGTVSPSAGSFIISDASELYEYKNYSEFLSQTIGTLVSCLNPSYQFSISSKLIGSIAHNLGSVAHPMPTDNSGIAACTNGNGVFVYSKPYGINQSYYSAWPPLSVLGTCISKGFLYDNVYGSASTLPVFASTSTIQNWPTTNNPNVGPMDNNPLISASPLQILGNNNNYLINHSRPVSAIGTFKT